ncbi:MAG: hypothetical protein LHV69_05850 [Elusimicrobia bacterium]|nr:hypothetical protein [Candidatus Obscuribacterium magneticum]
MSLRTETIVIPAKAGIQDRVAERSRRLFQLSKRDVNTGMDSRFRGNDDL